MEETLTPSNSALLEMLHAILPKTMASVTSEMTELTMRDQESDSDGDFDLESDDLCTDVVYLVDVVYLNTVDDEQAHTKKVSDSWNV